MKRVKLLTERTLREKKYLLRGKYSKTSQLIVPPTLLNETISFEGESREGGREGGMIPQNIFSHKIVGMEEVYFEGVLYVSSSQNI